MGEQLTLIDPPPFFPSWPTRNTLADRALKLFLNGRVFDHPDFIEGAGSWRLAAVVFQLRMLGWPIDTIDLTHARDALHAIDPGCSRDDWHRIGRAAIAVISVRVPYGEPAHDAIRGIRHG